MKVAHMTTIGAVETVDRTVNEGEVAHLTTIGAIQTVNRTVNEGEVASSPHLPPGDSPWVSHQLLCAPHLEGGHAAITAV